MNGFGPGLPHYCSCILHSDGGTLTVCLTKPFLCFVLLGYVRTANFPNKNVAINKKRARKTPNRTRNKITRNKCPKNSDFW